MRAVAGLRRASRRVWWFVTELTGENAYQRYVERARGENPAEPVLDRRQFERRRTDTRATDPRDGFRCC